MTRVMAVVAALLFALAWDAAAHEVRPGYLELRELTPDRIATLWKVPAQGDLRFGIRAVWPERCTVAGEPHETWTGDAYIERAVLQCRDGLDGATITIRGLSATLVDVLARVVRADGSTQVVRLTPAAPSFVVSAAPGFSGVARTYVLLGVEHILFGVDHLLFVLALVLLVGATRPVRATRELIATVTAFTAAHSLSLAAATLGWVHVPARPVEAVIALSIVFVAAEIVHARNGATSLTARKPWLVAFAFGLLHGLGFAGALAEVGLPPQAIPLALFCFNVGVELGQLAFIATVLTLLALLARVVDEWPTWTPLLPPYAIGAVAAYWTLARLALL